MYKPCGNVNDVIDKINELHERYQGVSNITGFSVMPSEQEVYQHYVEARTIRYSLELNYTVHVINPNWKPKLLLDRNPGSDLPPKLPF